jgi:hypothetical protein
VTGSSISQHAYLLDQTGEIPLSSANSANECEILAHSQTPEVGRGGRGQPLLGAATNPLLFCIDHESSSRIDHGRNLDAREYRRKNLARGEYP